MDPMQKTIAKDTDAKRRLRQLNPDLHKRFTGAVFAPQFNLSNYKVSNKPKPKPRREQRAKRFGGYGFTRQRQVFSYLPVDITSLY